MANFNHIAIQFVNNNSLFFLFGSKINNWSRLRRNIRKKNFYCFTLHICTNTIKLCMYIWHLHKKYKIYIHNWFFLFLLWFLKIKMHFEKNKTKQKKAKWWSLIYCRVLQYVSPILALREQYWAHWQEDSTQILMAHCFQNNQVSSKTYLCSDVVRQTFYLIMPNVFCM